MTRHTASQNIRFFGIAAAFLFVIAAAPLVAHTLAATPVASVEPIYAKWFRYGLADGAGQVEVTAVAGAATAVHAEPRQVEATAGLGQSGPRDGQQGQ